MEKIPTAEELFKDYAELCQFEEGPNEYMVDKEDFIKVLKEFAKLHVEQALKEASERAKIRYEYNVHRGAQCKPDYIDKDSILNSYSLDNIK